MGTSLQRVIVLTVVLNFVLLLTAGFIGDTSRTANDEFDTFNNDRLSWQSNFSQGFENVPVDTATTVLDKSYGNTFFALGNIWSLLSGGIDGYKDQCDTNGCSEFEIVLRKTFFTFILILNLLLVFELILLIYTKKNS